MYPTAQSGLIQKMRNNYLSFTSGSLWTFQIKWGGEESSGERGKDKRKNNHVRGNRREEGENEENCGKGTLKIRKFEYLVRVSKVLRDKGKLMKIGERKLCMRTRG